MSDAASSLVRKLWQYCNVLRDDGLSYPDYVEQLTYLLFLKMSDEQGGPVESKYGWQSLVRLDTAGMHRHYGEVLAALGRRNGMLGLIFGNAKNKIRDPAKLRLLIVDLIGQTEWSGLAADVKGDAYEGLLEKNARDTKSGAGQYFTPRPLIEAIVQCVDPQLGEVICDPACGTAGFLLGAHDYLSAQHPRMTARQRKHLRTKAIRGVELVEEVARLATMNLLLHGVHGEADDELPIACVDSLRSPPSTQVDVVITNPPFGVKGSVTYGAPGKKGGTSLEELAVERADFWVETANKQLNFLQHITSLLTSNGRAAVVVPDNVLFEGGAAAVIRRRLLEKFTVHTLLRLPSGLFYAAGVKANVLFFDKSAPTEREPLWVYDLRTDNRFSLKTNPLSHDDLSAFVRLYRPKDRSDRVVEGTRWRPFDRLELLARTNASLDLSWSSEREIRRSSSMQLDELTDQITNDLERALVHMRALSKRKR